jgi:hypothetical protein
MECCLSYPQADTHQSPQTQSQNAQRPADRPQIKKNSISIEATDAANLISDGNSQSTGGKNWHPSKNIKTRQNCDDGLSDKLLSRLEGTPLQRWLKETTRNESWNSLRLIGPSYQFADGPLFKHGSDSISNCDATCGSTAQWESGEESIKKNGSELGSLEASGLESNAGVGL